MDEKIDRPVLFSGYAKLPQGTSDYNVAQVIGLIVLVDTATGRIEEADCTLSSRICRKVLTDLLVGESLATSVTPIIRQLMGIYHDDNVGAIASAIRIIHDKYSNYVKLTPPSSPDLGDNLEQVCNC